MSNSNPTPCIVRHELGAEAGEIIGRTHGDNRRYVVRFADGTVSSWPAAAVVVG